MVQWVMECAIAVEEAAGGVAGKLAYDGGDGERGERAEGARKASYAKVKCKP